MVKAVMLKATLTVNTKVIFSDLKQLSLTRFISKGWVFVNCNVI